MVKYILRMFGRRMLSGSAQWMVPTAFLIVRKLFKSVFKGKELVDLSNSKPGDRFVITHLDETHSEQISRAKKDKRQKRKAKRAK